MLRLLYNRTIVKYALALLGIVIALYFAWNFYPFGEWSGKQFLNDVPLGPQILGAICAFIMFGLVLLLVFHKEYMKEDVKAFGAMKGDQSYERALSLLVWFAIGLEGVSIIFRVTILNTGKFNPVLIGAGVLGMGLSYVISKVLHALVYRPPSMEAERIMTDAGNLVMSRAGKDMGKLGNDDLRRIHRGDFNPINMVQDKRRARKARKQQEEDKRFADFLNRQKDAHRVAETFLDPKVDSPTPLMEPHSENGTQTIRGDGRSIVTHYPPL